MLHRDGNENVIIINRYNLPKKFARATHFFVHFFAIVLHH